MENNYQNLATWLENQTQKIDYGEIVVRVVRHAGQTRYIEKTVTCKEQPGQGQGVKHEKI